MGGCITSERFGDYGRDGEVVLTLSLGELTRYSTPNNGIGEGSNDNERSTGDSSIVSLNENRLTTLEIFLYANGAEGGNATFATRIDDINARDRADNVRFAIPAAAINTLFANKATTCGIYVIANYNTGRTVATNGVYENTSLAELKAIEVEASFDATIALLRILRLKIAL